MPAYRCHKSCHDWRIKGGYLASESTFYRVRYGEVHHRGRRIKPRPTTFTASGPCQVWTLDITWLPSMVRDRWYYLYLVEDVFIRKITGAKNHETESGELAAALMQRTVLREHCYRQPLVLHADNGAAMKSQTLQLKLAELNISPSHSRPRVSNDTAYVESLFRTLKYVPQWPSSGFKTREEAWNWVDKFTHWYTEEHRHRGIGYVTPLQRHTGEDKVLLAQRDKVYQAARALNPKRWSRQTRNWEWQDVVMLNPERENRPHKLTRGDNFIDTYRVADTHSYRTIITIGMIAINRTTYHRQPTGPPHAYSICVMQKYDYLAVFRGS
jgi:putative transposase